VGVIVEYKVKNLIRFAVLENWMKMWTSRGLKLQVLNQGKQAKLQWLQNPSQKSGDNMNNIRGKINRTFRNKNKIFERNITELLRNSKNRDIIHFYRTILEFKRDYKPRT
jgi:hypothetical protein